MGALGGIVLLYLLSAYRPYRRIVRAISRQEWPGALAAFMHGHRASVSQRHDPDVPSAHACVLPVWRQRQRYPRTTLPLHLTGTPYVVGGRLRAAHIAPVVANSEGPHGGGDKQRYQGGYLTR
ncbi:hypothetical protein K466DRAFT_221791 [Polyporus arcularius HHB13444]|uniref:Uncharacterized protein n=1 Tax=Polyporus arcularius HHB13444 TaxID=1314778 RepID=A0A5C3P4D4_9APHY|nr:hypothetical protein K466DRAFT_221791 [Polyporus arcularius HHB13444]